MISRMTAVLAALLFTCCQASAGVLYTWQNVDSGPHALPMGLVLEIEFTDAAVAAGNVDYVIDHCGLPEFCGPDKQSPVSRFLFSGVTPPISYFPQTQDMNPYASLWISVVFEPGGYLSGRIAANNTESNFAMSSAGTLFTVDSVRSDLGSGGGCDLWSNDCHGATGLMRLTEVPEPGSMILFAIAMIGLLIAGRRR